MYAHASVDVLPARSSPVRSMVFAPAELTSAGPLIGDASAPEVASVTVAETRPPGPFSTNTGGGDWQVTVGGVPSIFTVIVFSESADAPVFGGVMPSVASHSILCVPSVVSENDPVRGFEPAWFSTATGLPLSVHTRSVTPESSVAETLTVIAAAVRSEVGGVEVPVLPGGRRRRRRRDGHLRRIAGAKAGESRLELLAERLGAHRGERGVGGRRDAVVARVDGAVDERAPDVAPARERCPPSQVGNTAEPAQLSHCVRVTQFMPAQLA